MPIVVTCSQCKTSFKAPDKLAGTMVPCPQCQGTISVPGLPTPESVPAEFDPFFKWLGIPPEEQPPNHYRLLGIPIHTSDPDVIESAADQRMAHLRTLSTGQRSPLAQSLLNQVAAAKQCLLDPQKRAGYNSQLAAETKKSIPARPQKIIAVKPKPLTASAVGTDTPMAMSAPVANSINTTPGRKKKSGVIEIVKIVLGGLGGVVLAFFVLRSLNPNFTFNSSAANPPIQVSQAHKESDAADIVSPGNMPNESSELSQESVPSAEEKVDNNISSASPFESPPPNTDTVEEQLTRLEEFRGQAITDGNLSSAVRAVGDIATLKGTSPLEAKLSFLEATIALPEFNDSQLTHAKELVQVLEEAISEDRLDLIPGKIDHLLRLARAADDRNLERRATRVALKWRTASR